MEHMDAMGEAELQIWNNAAYDEGGDSSGSASLKKPLSSSACYPLRPIPAVRHSKGLFHAATDKENQGMGMAGSPPAATKTPAAVGKTFPLTPVPAKQPASAWKAVGFRSGGDSSNADVGDIDAEIGDVEKEIGRLTLRLEALRLRKAEKEDARAPGRRGRIVPAKFLKPKMGSDKSVEVPASRRVLESPFGRRGASLGPLDIISSGVGLQLPQLGNTPGRASSVRSTKDNCKSWAVFKLQGVAEEDGEEGRKKQGTPATVMRSRRAIDTPSAAAVAPSSVGLRRGASLGPSEIAAPVGCRRPGKKPREIKASRTKKGSGRSLSSNPKNPSRKTAAKSPVVRKGIATVVESEKPSKRDNHPAPAPKNLRPMTLFQEAKKQPAKAEHRETAPQSSLLRLGIPSLLGAKKPTSIKKPGKKMRTVASRYILVTVRVGRNPQEEGKRRKWSLPDSGKDDDGDAAGAKKYRMSMPAAGQKSSAMGSKCEDEEEAEDAIEGSPPSLVRIARQLPKIRTVRCGDVWSPRDSGRAKRVAELVGREESQIDAAVETEVAAADDSCESVGVGRRI